MFFSHINTSGDGAISQAASADDIIMATEGGKLAENKKLLIKQKLGGGKFYEALWRLHFIELILYVQ
jgi:hypothetical protein